MNTTDERELMRALREQANQVDAAGVTFDGITTRAHAVTRRRRMVAGAGVVAAAAMLVPAAMFVGGPAFDSSELPPATTGPRPTEGGDTATPDAREFPTLPKTELVVTGLPMGDAPKVPYFVGTTFYPGDGSSFELPAGHRPVAPYDDGWLIVNFDGTRDIGVDAQVTDADGELVGKPFVMTDSVAASSANGAFTLYTRDGQLLLHDNESGDDEVIRTAGPEDYVHPVGVADDGTAFFNLYANDAPEGHSVKDGVDTVEESGRAYQAVASNGAVTTLTFTDAGSCSTVLPFPGAQVTGTTCDLSLVQFSPDATRLLAGPAYRDGAGDGEMAVVSREIRGLEPAPTLHYLQTKAGSAIFTGVVWEDNEHLLARMWDYKTWQLVRIGLDGSVENVVEPIEGDADSSAPFGFLD